MGMKQGLEAFLQDRPSLEAIFVGTRRTDPHGELLTHFDMTDDGWPKFMRVHPVIDWKYGEYSLLLGLCMERLTIGYVNS